MYPSRVAQYTNSESSAMSTTLWFAGIVVAEKSLSLKRRIELPPVAYR